MATDVGTRVGRFVWHDLATGDVERAKEFYVDLLGWEIEVFKPGEMDYPMISSGGIQHGGFGPTQGGAPPHWMGHVHVEDLDSTLERVARERRHRARRPDGDPGGRAHGADRRPAGRRPFRVPAGR